MHYKDVSDIPLTGNPQITYFSKVYRRHTPFTIKRSIQFGCKDGNNSNRISHHGELIKSIDLEIKITGNTVQPDDNIGTSLLKNITMQVGDQKIEQLSGSYIEMYMKLCIPRGLHTFYNKDNTTLVCREGDMEQILSFSGGVYNPFNINASNITILLPIPFSFCNDIGNSLPYFLFHLNKPLDIFFLINTNTYGANGSIKYNLIINYIVLSNEEKMRFRSSKNEYFFERVYEHTIDNNYFTNEKPYDIEKIYGNIKSIMWVNNVSNNFKYNISINNNLLLNQNKTYHYFTRKTIQSAGFPGGGNKEGTFTSKPLVVSDDSIAFYSFSLKDYIKDTEDSSTPSGSVSSHTNQIRFIIENSGDNKRPNIVLFIKSYNIMNINEDYFEIEYQQAGYTI